MQRVRLSNDHDLFRIRTLGFRGEALASIASVSKIIMWTSDGETEGTEVQIDGGRLVKHDNAAFRKGTDITVSQLFFNTPARLKYMKTIQTELGHTIDLVNRLALSHPTIAFKLTHYSQVLLQTAGSGDQRRVLSDIYGIAVARKMVPFRGRECGLQSFRPCNIARNDTCVKKLYDVNRQWQMGKEQCDKSCSTRCIPYVFANRTDLQLRLSMLKGIPI